MFNRAIFSDDCRVRKPGSVGYTAFNDDAEAGILSLFSDREEFSVYVCWYETKELWEVWYFEDQYRY